MKRHDLAIFAMAAIAIPASVNAAESGVAGSVHVFPACLAPQAQDQGCVKRYSEARVEVRDATGALVQFANADTDGNFRVPLPPGSYQVAIEAQGGVWPSCESVSALVRDGVTTRVDIACDSRLR